MTEWITDDHGNRANRVRAEVLEAAPGVATGFLATIASGAAVDPEAHAQSGLDVVAHANEENQHDD